MPILHPHKRRLRQVILGHVSETMSKPVLNLRTQLLGGHFWEAEGLEEELATRSPCDIRGGF